MLLDQPHDEGPFYVSADMVSSCISYSFHCSVLIKKISRNLSRKNVDQHRCQLMASNIILLIHLESLIPNKLQKRYLEKLLTPSKNVLMGSKLSYLFSVCNNFIHDINVFLCIFLTFKFNFVELHRSKTIYS
jgi:hypothetical protein